MKTKCNLGLAYWLIVSAAAATASAACSSKDDEGPRRSTSAALVRGAAFTTFDATQGGCLDSPNGIDCNHYRSKADVYMSGGPNAAGVSNGDYYFAVLVPGHQNGGFIDGADGNLSDTTAGATTGDLGSGDTAANRTFTVVDHEISTYGGTHAIGTAPNGRKIIQLVPFDDTSNPGGVYILVVCKVGATSPRDCKFDAFHAPPSVRPPPPPVDAGPPPEDAAPPPVDAGMPPEDAAPPPEDAAVPPSEDAGAPDVCTPPV